MSKERDSKLPAKSSEVEIDAFLRQAAAVPAPLEADQRGRLIFALDATASRGPTWDRACHIQAEMFTETAGLGGLEIQLIYYRGFGECRASPWLTKSRDLLGFMTRVFCLGGQTQIAKVLRRAIGETKKKKVNALVFVGDCMEEDPDEICHLAGELGLLGVPAFIFHEGGERSAAQTFRQVAQLTKGAYCAFDASSPKALRDLLSAVAVYAAGGRRALKHYSSKTGGETLLLARQVK